jgi:hypothetical protein
MAYGNKRLGKGLQRKRPHEPLPEWSEESMHAWLGAKGVGRHGGGLFRHEDQYRSPAQTLRLRMQSQPSGSSAEAGTELGRPRRTYTEPEVRDAAQKYCVNNRDARRCPNVYPVSGTCNLSQLSDHRCFGHDVPRFSGWYFWQDQELIDALEGGGFLSKQEGGGVTGQPSPEEMRTALRTYCGTTTNCDSYGCKISSRCLTHSYLNPGVTDADLPAAFEQIRGLV